MARQRKKSDLPTKVCPVCNRPFTWRKKNGQNAGMMLNTVLIAVVAANLKLINFLVGEVQLR